MTQKPIGSTFPAELEAAGLLGLPFSWDVDGNLTFGADLTPQQQAAVQAVYDAHDPKFAALVAARAAKREAIAAAYEDRIAAGVVHAGHVYQIDPESRANISAIALSSALATLGVPGVSWPAGGQPYRTMANEWLTFSPAEFLSLSVAVRDVVTAMRQHYAALKEEVAAAGDLDALAAIDPSAGWPT